MASFTAKDVQLLREKTGAGMMDCKKCLQEASGNIEEAIVLLRKKGAAKAEKKASRLAAEGLIFLKVEDNKGAILEINSETDFVAKNEKFKNFGNDILNIIIKKEPKNLQELLSLSLENSKNISIEEELKEKIATIGENIKIRRFKILNGNVYSYLHGEGTIGVLVKFKVEGSKSNKIFLDYAKNIAMQVAALNPQYLSSEDVPKEVVEKEKDIAKEQLKDSKKPANIIEKIVEGKLNNFFKEVCLYNQKYIKDDSISIRDYTKKISKELGEEVEILEFVVMKKGEGLEKRNNDFADEVISMLK